MSPFSTNSFWCTYCRSVFAPVSGLRFWSVMCVYTHSGLLLRVGSGVSVSLLWLLQMNQCFTKRSGCCDVHGNSPAAVFWTFTLRIILSCQKKRQLYFVHVQSCVDYPTAAVTRKTPTPALACLRIGLCHIAPAFSRILQHLLPRLYDDSTTSSCPPFLPQPLPCQPVREKLGKGRAGSTASGRRSGTPAANGRPYCPGRAQVQARTKGPVWRRK